MLARSADLPGGLHVRYISWNFVSSAKERLKQAASVWHHQRFACIPAGTPSIPLPEDGDAPTQPALSPAFRRNQRHEEEKPWDS